MSQVPEFRYQILKCAIDEAGRRKIKLTTGSYDSSGKRTPGRDRSFAPQDIPNLVHPWRSCTGILCKFLAETVAAEKHVSVDQLKDGTYRIAFDYRTSRYVAVIDPSKGYTCALWESYNKQGQLTSRETATYKEMTEGIWFPISGQTQIYAPESMLRKSTFKSSQIKINDPDFDFGYYEEDPPEGTQADDRVQDSAGSQESPVEEKRFDPNSWQESFYSIYSLKDREVLKRIAPPFIPERREYFKFVQPGKYSANTPYHLVKQFVFGWDGDLNVRNVKMGYGDPRLSTILESVIGLGRDEYDVPAEILDTEIPGDWIIRKDAPKEDLLRVLERIMKLDTASEIHFIRQEMESEVIVARGKYRLMPLPNARNRDRVQVYTDKIDDFSGAGGGSGTLSKFLRWVGNRVRMNIIDRTDSGDVELSWRNHHSSDLNRLEHNEQLHNEEVDMLLNNLARQMGLTFERKTAPVEKWFIADQESSAESVASSPAIARSPISPGEDKPHIRVDCRVLEIYPPGKIDRETQIAIENLLATITTSTPKEKDGVLTRTYRISGKSTRTGEKPTVEELIREAAGTTHSVGDSSIVTENPQATQHLRTMIDLLVSRNWAKILMNPTLEVADGQTAKIKSNQDYLQITPEVLDDSSIMLRAEGTFTRLSMPKSEEQTPGMIETSISTQARIIGGRSLIIYGKNKPGKNTEIDSDADTPEEQMPDVLFILTPTVADTGKIPDKTDDLYAIYCWQIPIDDQGLRHVARLSGLKVLWLAHTPISDKGLAHLRDLKSLRSLQLTDNPQITGAGLVHIGKLSWLKSVSLREIYEVGDDDIAHLTNLTGLTSFATDSDRITDAGVAHLSNLHSLEGLALENAGLTDKALSHVARLKKLEYVHLGGSFTDAGLRHLEGLSLLKSLTLPGAGLSTEALEELERKLPLLANLKAQGASSRNASPIGRQLTGFDGIDIDYSMEQAAGAKIVLCFFDAEQRPSRNLVERLAKREKELLDDGVAVLLVHTSNVEADKLKQWLDNREIPFRCGSIKDDAEKVLYLWGVQAQPWLVLMDDQGTVSAGGFGLESLTPEGLGRLLDPAKFNAHVYIKHAEPEKVAGWLKQILEFRAENLMYPKARPVVAVGSPGTNELTIIGNEQEVQVAIELLAVIDMPTHSQGPLAVKDAVAVIYRLEHVDCEQFAKLLRSPVTDDVLVEVIRLAAAEKILVRASRADHDWIQRLIRLLDVPPGGPVAGQEFIEPSPKPEIVIPKGFDELVKGGEAATRARVRPADKEQEKLKIGGEEAQRQFRERTDTERQSRIAELMEKALPQKMSTRVYDVTDLIGDPTDHGGMSRIMQAQNLVQFIQRRVEPESWYDISDAGEGTATPFPIQHPKKLAIYQTLMNHRAIQRLLEK